MTEDILYIIDNRFFLTLLLQKNPPLNLGSFLIF